MSYLANLQTPHSKPGQTNMQALILKRYGKRDNVTFAGIPRPVPKPDEILVQVHAVGLNPIDYMIPKGTFKPILKFELPATLGSDLAGVVVEVGNRVTRFKPGDAVFASVFDLGRGSLAEFAVVPANAAARKPANLDFVQAASIPMVALTSWQALKERTNLKPGQKVFIPAGSGGIGTVCDPARRNTLARRSGRPPARQTWISSGASAPTRWLTTKSRRLRRCFATTMPSSAQSGATNSKSRSGFSSWRREHLLLTSGHRMPRGWGTGISVFMVALFRFLSRKIIRLSKKRGVTYSFLFVRPDGSQLAEIGELLKSGAHPAGN